MHAIFHPFTFMDASARSIGYVSSWWCKQRAMIACSVTLMLGASASTAENAVPSAAISTAAQISQLGAARWQDRESAQQALWSRGLSVKSDLEAAQNSSEPEIALRAQQLLRLLKLGIKPQSPQSIYRLAEHYPLASLAEKREILAQLKKIEAWQCALYLFHRETPLLQRRDLAPLMNGVAILATRQFLENNDRVAALALLEEYADDENCNLARMWLLHPPDNAPQPDAAHKLSECSTSEQIAIARIRGQRDLVIELTENDHRPLLGATMRLLQGDVRDWLRLNPSRPQNQAVLKPYTLAALAEWNGDFKFQVPVQQLEKIAQNDEDQDTRQFATQALMALGKNEAATNCMRQLSIEELFEHYCDIERNADALRLLKIQPDAANLSEWLAKQVSIIIEDAEKYEITLPPLLQALAFAERKGLYQEIDSSFVPKMLDLADKHPELFEEILINCFTPHGKSRQAAYAGMQVAIAYAQHDAQRWNAMLMHAFQQQTSYSELWQLLQQLFPKTSAADLYRQTLVLFRVVQDRQHERETLVAAIHQALKAMNAEQTKQHLPIIDLLQLQTDDLAVRFQLLDFADNPLVLMNLRRWDHAILAWQQRLKTAPRVEFRVSLAACLRAAGRDPEAQVIEKSIQPLILADVTLMTQMAQIYASTGDFTRAQQWNERVLNCGSPDEPGWWQALTDDVEWTMEQRQWRISAALYEALLLESLNGRYYSANLSQLLRLRLAARSAACLAHLEQVALKQKTTISQVAAEADLQILKDAHTLLAMDASLADHFFPSLRAAGLNQLHDELFEQSWQLFHAACQRFPQDDNLHNSASWLAARALRRLDEAKTIQQLALALNPHQGAYLDTMAEICFAQGQRQQAVAWSAQSLAASPQAEPLRRQYFRFAHESFPKN